MPLKTIVATIFEYALIAFGWFLIWRFQFSAAAKERRKNPPALPHWTVSAVNFTIAAFCVCIGWFTASVILGILIKSFPSLGKDEPLRVIVGGLISELCIITGAIAGAFYLRRTDQTAQDTIVPTSAIAAAPAETHIVRAALVTFLITVAVVYPVQWLWEQVLVLCHLPTAKQEMVEMFYRTASPSRVAGLTAMAVLFAPVAEELIFRGGLFRFLRGRLPHWVALGLPALIFAGLHVNRDTLEGLITLAPLTAFGVIFSLAYERTGRIAVVMLAHALFNLHTVVFLLLDLNN